MRPSRPGDLMPSTMMALAGVVALVTTVAGAWLCTVPVGAPQVAPLHGAGPTAVGNATCAVCHRTEVKSLLRTENVHGQSLERFRSIHAERAQGMLARLKDSEVWGDDAACSTCHGMTATAWSGGRAVETVTGVGCESCHGPAGEEGGRPAEGRPRGWLNPHASYGPGVLARSGESPEHMQRRQARMAAAGMRTATGSGVYEIARRCYDCHFIGDDELLDHGGHRVGNAADLEFLTWSMGWSRHNFLIGVESSPDRPTNADVSSLALARAGGDREDAIRVRKRTLYVIGQLARLETGLRVLLRTKEGSAFDNAWDQLVEPSWEFIEELAAESEVAAAYPWLVTVWNAIESVEDWKDEIEDAESVAGLARAADVVGREGRALAKGGVIGNASLSVLDEQIKEREVKGEAWRPR